MFRAGNAGSVSDEEPRYAFPAMFLWLPCAKGAVSRLRLTEGVSYAEFFLRQICGFAGLYILLFIISGTPLSLLVQRKLQRSTRRRGEKNLPALRSTPLRAESFLFRSSPAAHDADLPALLMKCFVLETHILSPMK